MSKYLSKLLPIGFTDFEKQQIIVAEELFNPRKMSASRVVGYIRTLKEYNVSFSSLSKRISKILLLGKDSSSKKFFYYRYGLKEGYRRFKEKCIKSARTRADYISKYGVERTNELLSNRGASESNYIKRYGEILGRQKWQAYLIKRAASYAQKHIDGYNFAKYNEEFFIIKYGKEKGSEVYYNKLKNQRYKVSRQRYIDELGDVEGRQRCKEVKNNTSIESFISRHGEVDGTTSYLKYITKMSNDITTAYINGARVAFKGTEDAFVGKYGEVEGKKLFKKKIDNLANSCKSTRSRSKISTEMFDYISVFINGAICYGENETAIVLDDETKRKYKRHFIKPDLIYNNRIIEFYGDVYHANPSIYAPRDTPNPRRRGITSSVIWEEDRIRLSILQELGYMIKIVWSADYVKHKHQTITECVEFLNESNI